ncbi:MAG: hypothetical protein KC535_01325 [Nanoarchaeota archaeon]|nr:hypothetical protein [Nanoarchaeota archaeon]
MRLSHRARTSSRRRRKEMRRQEEESHSLIQHLNKEIMTDTKQIQYPFQTNRFYGLKDLYNLSTKAYTAKKGYAVNELFSLEGTPFFELITYRFNHLREKLDKETSFVIINKHLTTGYQAGTSDKGFLITPQYNNVPQAIGFFDDWHLNDLSIIQDSTSKIKELFFEKDKPKQFMFIPREYTAPKEKVLASISLRPSQEEQNAMEFVALRKILREAKHLPFYYNYSQEEQHKDLLEAICRSYQGELEVAQTHNHSLLVDKEQDRDIDSGFIYSQARKMYTINRFFEEFYRVTEVDQIAKKLLIKRTPLFDRPAP